MIPAARDRLSRQQVSWRCCDESGEIQVSEPAAAAATGGPSNCSSLSTVCNSLRAADQSASLDWLEVVLLKVLGDLLAEHVGGAKVDAGPHSRVDNFAQDIGQAVEASCLIERQLLGRASVKRERRTNVQRSMPHRPLYSRDHGPLIPSEVACPAVALCEDREESLTFF